MTDREHEVRVDSLGCRHESATEAANRLVGVVGWAVLVVVLDVEPAEVAHVVLRIELSLGHTGYARRNAKLNRVANVDVGVLEVRSAPCRIHQKLRIGWVRSVKQVRLDLGVNTASKSVAVRHVVDHVDVAIVSMADAQRTKKLVTATGVTEVFADGIVITSEAAACDLIGDETENRATVLHRQRMLHALLDDEGFVEVLKNAVGKLRCAFGRAESHRSFTSGFETRLSNNFVAPLGPVVPVPLDPVVAHLLIESTDDSFHLLLARASEQEVVDAEPRRIDRLVVELHFAESLMELNRIGRWDTRVPISIIERNCGPRIFVLRSDVRTLKHDVGDLLTHFLRPSHFLWEGEPRRRKEGALINIVGQSSTLHRQVLVNICYSHNSCLV